MKFDTSTLRQNTPLSENDREGIYNGLDCCVTFEVFEELSKMIREKNEPFVQLIYDFERGLQAPAMDMMLRGWKIDQYERNNAIRSLEKRLVRLEWILDQYATAIWKRGLNARSYTQLKAFFYGAMGLPEIVLSFNGIKRVTCNREALEKLSNYFEALPIVKCIFTIRDVSKLLSVLKTKVDRDGRMRTTYNIAGTETGRWSSTHSIEGTGTNLQNITPELRNIFIADDSYKLGHIDLEQAESRIVGLILEVLFNDRKYTDAHESGDLHTANAKLIWPSVVRDQATAEAHFYFQYTYRDMSKRGGHATNYKVTAWTLSRGLHIPQSLAEDFQGKYLGAYPAIPKWHQWVATQVQLHSTLNTPLGRQRIFFGRPGDDSTIREAIAFVPQSTVADILNVILWQIWSKMPKVQLLGQTHDSIDFQFKEEDEVEVLTEVKKLANIEITMEDKSLTIPIDIMVGWNWARQDRHPFTPATNPNGLKKWKGEKDARVRVSGLDRFVA